MNNLLLFSVSFFASGLFWMLLLLFWLWLRHAKDFLTHNTVSPGTVDLRVRLAVAQALANRRAYL